MDNANLTKIDSSTSNSNLPSNSHHSGKAQPPVSGLPNYSTSNGHHTPAHGSNRISLSSISERTGGHDENSYKEDDDDNSSYFEESSQLSKSLHRSSKTVRGDHVGASRKTVSDPGPVPDSSLLGDGNARTGDRFGVNRLFLFAFATVWLRMN